jgi:hypothetical protein
MSLVPSRPNSSLLYHRQRVAGDFYEFLRVGPSRVLFGLFDPGGRREDTRAILIAAQGTFRSLAPNLFAGKDFNEAEAMVGLCHAINCTILEVAGGIRSCGAFIGCYNEDLGTVCYTAAISARRRTGTSECRGSLRRTTPSRRLNRERTKSAGGRVSARRISPFVS